MCMWHVAHVRDAVLVVRGTRQQEGACSMCMYVHVHVM